MFRRFLRFIFRLLAPVTAANVQHYRGEDEILRMAAHLKRLKIAADSAEQHWRHGNFMNARSRAKAIANADRLRRDYDLAVISAVNFRRRVTGNV